MHDNIAKKRSKSLVIPTGKTTDHVVGSAIPKIDLRELTCQYPSHIKPSAK